MERQELRKLIKERFNYSEGKLIWKYNYSREAKKGTQAGNVVMEGYRNIKMDGKNYRAHRLIWLYIRGDYPSTVSHINGNSLDNRIENLYKANQSSNARVFTYQGKEHSNLKFGKKYTLYDISHAVEIGQSTMSSRFRHRNITHIFRDCDLYPVKAKVSRCKLFPYEGNHPDLISGQSYSYVQLGVAFGIHDKLIRDRMRGSRVFTDAMAVKTPGGDQFMRCETRSAKMMDQWMRRRIV
tara:strand:- start:1172 stop:1888 length:717 start_codon:yes stop_codon:yes gene_type:complete